VPLLVEEVVIEALVELQLLVLRRRLVVEMLGA
jgi:hypothetical protein